MDGVPPEAAFETRHVFLRELESLCRPARENLDLLLKDPRDAAALAALGDFFHKIAGTAHAADLALLGHLSAVCERACDLARAGAPVEKLLPLFGDGVAGVVSVLESHASTPASPRVHPGLVHPGGARSGCSPRFWSSSTTPSAPTSSTAVCAPRAS
jgi:hypothetical protein